MYSLFVEGASDKALIECLLKFQHIDQEEVVVIGGGVSKLGKVANEIRRRYDTGRAVAMILDADRDPDKRRTEYDDEVRTHNLQVDRVFFLPDNQSSGCLENLLQQIALPKHNLVYDCFRKYEECLRTGNPAYRLPSLKGRVYAYCEAVGGVKAMGSREKPVLAACRDASYWNFAAAELKPLMDFLGSLEGPV